MQSNKVDRPCGSNDAPSDRSSECIDDDILNSENEGDLSVYNSDGTDDGDDPF